MYPPDPPDPPEMETCICGAANADEEGEWIAPAFPGFCSEACHDQAFREAVAEAEAEAAAMAEWSGQSSAP